MEFFRYMVQKGSCDQSENLTKIEIVWYDCMACFGTYTVPYGHLHRVQILQFGV